MDAILDWRDADNLTRLNGAESNDYTQQGYRARDGDFTHIEEIQYVKGYSQTLLEKTLADLTVQTQTSAVYLPAANKNVKAALDHYQHRHAKTSKDGQKSHYHLTTNDVGDLFEIKSTATTDNTRYSVYAHVKLSADLAKPYSILNWREQK